MSKFKVGDGVVSNDYPDYGVGTIVVIDSENVVKFDKDIDTYSHELVSDYKSDKNDLWVLLDIQIELAPN